MSANLSLAEHFRQRVSERPEAPALNFKREDSYRVWNWRELEAEVLLTAAMLQQLGVERGDRVAHYSENRQEWVVVDLALLCLAAVHVPIHEPLTGAQAAYQIRASGSRVAIVSRPDVWQRLADQTLPEELQVVSFEPTGQAGILDWQTARAAVAGPLSWSEISPPNDDELATILFTSGTSGEPKGVMLSHGNLRTNTESVLETIGLFPEDLRLTFLPLSHIFARTCDLYTWLCSGAQLALAESKETVVANAQELSPTVINGVPYFYDRIRRTLIDNNSDTAEALAHVFGGRMRFCCSGGAALPVAVADFYDERGLPIHQGYGLTETSPVISLSTLGDTRRGSSGLALPGVEIAVADDGEILTRGPHVMIGYYKDPEATAEAIRDGWFYTGDLGYIDDDGFLFVTGRKKEIIVTMGGKNVAPVLIENLLTQDPLILQAVVVGDDQKYLAALIVPDPDNLEQAIVESNLPITSKPQALEHPEVLAWYQQRIEERLQELSAYEQVRRFKLLDRGFSIESGEMTPKLSLRRGVIQENFAETIAELYNSA